MSQKTIEVTLSVLGDVDVLLFGIESENKDCYPVNLNSPTSQNELKNIFSKLLPLLLTDDITLQFVVAEGYKKGLYKDVCKEYIDDLNRELVQVKGNIRRDIS